MRLRMMMFMSDWNPVHKYHRQNFVVLLFLTPAGRALASASCRIRRIRKGDGETLPLLDRSRGTAGDRT